METSEAMNWVRAWGRAYEHEGARTSNFKSQYCAYRMFRAVASRYALDGKDYTGALERALYFKRQFAEKSTAYPFAPYLRAIVETLWMGY